MRRLPAPLVLFAVVLTAYLANGRTIGAGDTLPALHFGSDAYARVAMQQ